MLVQEPVFEELPDRPMAHCATLTVLPDGALLSAWFGGTYETSRDVVILAARREPAGQAWSAPRVIAEIPDRALGQPVFLSLPGGELRLFFVVIAVPEPPPAAPHFDMLPPPDAWNSAQPYFQRSSDGGRTWETPQQLFDYPGFMFRSRPLLLPGRIILPAYDENTWESRMLISDDNGRTWRLTAPIVSPNGNIHASLAPLSDGRILAYLRSRGPGGHIWRTESRDYGDTWSEPAPTPLPNPNSGIDLLHLQSGRLALAFNNSQTARTPLCIALAGEDERWDRIRTLEQGPGEYSYPTLVQTGEGQIHIVYTYQRKHIHYARFTEDWIESGRLPLHSVDPKEA